MALSKNNKTFRPLSSINLSNFFNQVSKIPEATQAFLIVWYLTGNVFGLTRLKQRGFNNFQITNGVSLSLTIFAQRDIVSCIFCFLATIAFFLFLMQSFVLDCTEKKACLIHVKYITWIIAFQKSYSFQSSTTITSTSAFSPLFR